MSGRDRVYIRHIFDSIETIHEYVSTLSLPDFLANRMAQDATIRQLEIIGEATKKLSGGIKEKHPEIPWKDIAGMRDKLIHDYFGVDIEAVWDTATVDLPPLKEKISNILE